MERLEYDFRKPVRISTHADADGLAAASLLASVFDAPASVYPQRLFGNYVENSDFILDMRPNNPEGCKEAIVIDHHLGHPTSPPYRLIYEDLPASLIVYKLLKDRLPKEITWKVSVGCVGDGEPFRVPLEVIKSHPQLFEKSLSLYVRKAGEISTYEYPVWLLLASGLNALCKFKNETLAYQLIAEARSPLELVNDGRLIEAKSKLRDEVNRCFKEGIFMKIGEVVLGLINSEASCEKDLANKIEIDTHSTALIVNLRDNIISCRGILSSLLGEYFKDGKIIELGGHPGYMGGTLKSTPESLIEALRRLKW